MSLRPELEYFIGQMSALVSVTFSFDGTEKDFNRLYDAIAPLGLDTAAYSEGTTGVVEFMIDDFETFKERVAGKSAETGVPLLALDYWVSEIKA